MIYMRQTLPISILEFFIVASLAVCFGVAVYSAARRAAHRAVTGAPEYRTGRQAQKTLNWWLLALALIFAMVGPLKAVAHMAAGLLFG